MGSLSHRQRADEPFHIQIEKEGKKNKFPKNNGFSERERTGVDRIPGPDWLNYRKK